MKMKFFAERKILSIFLILFLFLTILFSLKSSIFRLILDQKVERVQEKHSIKISYSNAKLKGIKTIEINDLKISNQSDSTIVLLSKAKVVISLRNILRFNVKPISIVVDSLWINLNPLIGDLDRKSIDLPNDSYDSTSAASGKSIVLSKINSYTLQKALKATMLLATTKVEAINFSCSYSNSSYTFKLQTNNFASINGNFSSVFELNENNSISYISLNGNSDTDTKKFSIALTGNDESIKIPLVDKLFGLSSQFDSLGINVTRNIFTRDSVNVLLESSIKNLKLDHRQISDKEVAIDFAKLKLGIGITKSCIHFDSTSYFIVNDFSLPFSLSVNTAKSPRIKLIIVDQDINMQSLFESLPKGLFSSLSGIRVVGNAKFNLIADIDFENLDSLKFYVNLKPQNFRIQSFGSTDFRMLQDTFTYYTFQSDTSSKKLKLASSNKYFRHLDRISPYIKNAVVAAEDGGFYHHRGFDLEGFNYALIRNLKDKKLGRGGSTITMQLVKNVYLNRNKTLSRKGEEALIVWLIESQRLLEKERILEIYLNIIEWGPDIYGVTEAAEFYFEKDPADITLNEAIFLTSIIPRPKQFMYYFDNNGNLKDFMEGYFSFVGKTLLNRGLITDSEFENLTPNITITGRAVNLLRNQNTNGSINEFEADDLLDIEN